MDDLEKQYKNVIKNSEDVLKEGNTLLNSRVESSAKPVVVAWGLMNAGKSYLLNMLTEHIDKEYFKTNDFRETNEVKKFETEDFVFFDTPGLDGSTKDDLTAIMGVEKADIVLFVHQLQGELDAIEVDCLRSLVESFGEYASDNIIIVLSKVDKESDKNIEAIENKVLHQCNTYLGFEPKCIAVSNTVYKAGITKKIKGLIKNSNMETLHNCLQDLAETTEEVRKERDLQNKQQFIKELKDKKQELQLVLRQYHEKTDKFKADVQSFNTTINILRNFINRISKEYLELDF